MSDAGNKHIRRERGFSRVRNQLLAALLANMLVFAQGCNIGWFSPTLPFLRSPDSPLTNGKLTTVEIGWIGSLAALGAMMSTMFYGQLSIRFGFKWALLCSAPPLICSWFLIIFADSSWHVMLSRFMLGVSGGGSLLCIPQFVAEIADDFIRGQLNAYMMMIMYAGVLAGYVCGTYLDYYTNSWAMLSVPLVFLVLFAFMPETPQYLLRTKQLQRAERSIRFYRNCASSSATKDEELSLQSEFDKFQAIAEQNALAPRLRAADLLTPAARRAFLIVSVLLLVNQWSGSFILSNYAATVFKESGSRIDANVASIVMGVFQVCGNYAASQCVDRFGRRACHIVSTAGSTVSLAVTGAYVYCVRSGYDLTAYSAVPVGCLSFFIFICAIGVIPVPFIVMVEVMPPKIRKWGSMICVCVSFGLQFIIFTIFPYILEATDLHGTLMFFAVVTLFGLLFGTFVLKETRGLNLDVLEADAVASSAPQPSDATVNQQRRPPSE